MTNAVTPFAYHALAPDVAARIQETAAGIRQAAAMQVSEIIAIGTALLNVKRVLLHGQFGTWLAAEFGWSERTARNYMLAAEAFGSNRQRVADLPVTVVYRLAALPKHARDQILETQSGSEKDIINLISRHRSEADRQSAEARKSPEAKKRERERKARAERENEKHKSARDREEEIEQRRAEALLAQFDETALLLLTDLLKIPCNLVLAARDEVLKAKGIQKQGAARQ